MIDGTFPVTCPTTLLKRSIALGSRIVTLAWVVGLGILASHVLGR